MNVTTDTCLEKKANTATVKREKIKQNRLFLKAKLDTILYTEYMRCVLKVAGRLFSLQTLRLAKLIPDRFF